MNLRRCNGLTLCLILLLLGFFYYVFLSAITANIRNESCEPMKNAYGKCHKQRNLHLKEACDRLDLKETQVRSVYPNLLVDTTHKLLLCDVQLPGKVSTSTIEHFLLKDAQLAPLSDYEEQDQSEIFETYRRVLLAMHPLQRTLDLYEQRQSQKSFADFVQSLIDSDIPDAYWLPIMDVCMPCHITYDLILKQETIEQDSRYLSACSELAADEHFMIPQPKNVVSRSGKELPEYAKLDMKQLATILHKFSSDMMMFGYEWKMMPVQNGVLAISDGLNSKCEM